jgi:hypothetical protein
MNGVDYHLRNFHGENHSLLLSYANHNVNQSVISLTVHDFMLLLIIGAH